VLFSVIAAAIELAIMLFHFVILMHSTSMVARGISADVGGVTTGSALKALVNQRGKSFVSDSFGFDSTPFSFQGNTWLDGTGRCHIEVTGRRELKCMTCKLFRFDFSIASESSALIDDECLLPVWCET